MGSHTGLYPHVLPDLDELLSLDPLLQVPGSYGFALMAACMADKPRHSLPNLACIHDLKRNGANERSEGKRAKNSIKEDVPSAYPTFYGQRLPDGTCIRLTGSASAQHFVTWFMECSVVVPHSLPLAPFPTRVIHEKPDKTVHAELTWQQEPGEYLTWLWSEQAAICREAGCFVYPRHGWGWERWAESQRGWSELVIDARNRAGRGSELGTMWKNVANHAIGIHGKGNEYTRFVKIRDISRGDRPDMAPGGDCLSPGGRRNVKGRRTMIHWQRYTVMRCSVDAYQRALPFAREGRLLGIWTDCLEVAA